MPDEWKQTTLGKVMTFKNGLNFTKADVGEEIKIVGVADFKDFAELRSTEHLEQVNVSGYIKEEELLADGDLLFVRSNGNKDLIGRCLFFPKVYEKLSFSGFTIRGRAIKETVMPQYMASVAKSSFFKNQILKAGGGTNISNLSQQILNEVALLLPPLPEQKKIAQILSTWDKAITTAEQLLANSQQQKKALMQQLLTGKKRFSGYGGCSYSVRKGYAKSKLGVLPNAWKVELIKKHLWFQEGPGVRNHQFTESGIKLFNGTNIQFNKIDLSNTSTHISNDEALGAYKHFLVDDGDLLIACSGISVDRFDEKIVFASISHLPLCMNTSTLRFKELDGGNVDIRYFQYFMQSPIFKNQIRRQATGSAQLNFGPSHIGKCFVVVPSMEEQQKIASALTAADQEIIILQQKLDALKQEKKALMQQLLTGKRRVLVYS